MGAEQRMQYLKKRRARRTATLQVRNLERRREGENVLSQRITGGEPLGVILVIVGRIAVNTSQTYVSMGMHRRVHEKEGSGP
jgi:hypothetical protein